MRSHTCTKYIPSLRPKEVYSTEAHRDKINISRNYERIVDYVTAFSGPTGGEM